MYNSTIIEIYSDIIQVSHGFDGCQMLEYIADSNTSPLSAENDHITNFAGPLIYTPLLEESVILHLKRQINLQLSFHSKNPFTYLYFLRFSFKKMMNNKLGAQIHIISLIKTVNPR